MADSELVPQDTPEEVAERIREIADAPSKSRVPNFDPRLGVAVQTDWKGTPPNRLALIGDSLTHGFQSGAIFNTDLSYGAIIAHELGCLDRFRFPRYAGYGGLPLNVEYLLRDLEERYGPTLNVLETPLALFRARHLMDEIEDYWERGAGTSVPALATVNHCLAVYGWDLRDALSKTAKSCDDLIKAPNDDLLEQVIQNNGERAALRVYPGWDDDAKGLTVFQAAARLGDDHDAETNHGIETLIVFLGANNALGSVTSLKVRWSGDGYDDPAVKAAYNVWQPAHFTSELELVEAEVRKIGARHVIWCTVPHVTIAPIARGIGTKVAPGSRYFPYYTRPWIDEAGFRPHEDPCITGAEARAVDTAIDMYDDAIEAMVRGAREQGRDWYLLDIAGLLDRLAARRYINDPNARPPWWTPFPLPPSLKALDPVPDSRFLTSDGRGGRATGGLFSLDGVHPTTVTYGLIAQEMINVMRLAGVEFLHGQGALRTDPIIVDFERLIARDTLIRRPPQNLSPALEILGWADEAIDWTKRALARA